MYMLIVVAAFALLARHPVGAQSPGAIGAIDSVVVSRGVMVLSFALGNPSAGANERVAARGNAWLAVDNDNISSPRLGVTVADPPGPDAPRPPAECRGVTKSFSCRDSALVAVSNGQLIITIRHSSMIAWLFNERPAAVWIYAGFGTARSGYVAVRYVEPRLPELSKAALVKEDSIAASEGWGSWTRMMWTSTFGALDTVWMRVGERVTATLGEMQCRPIDSCNRRSDFSASGWTSSDSSIIRLEPSDNPRQVSTTMVGLRAGRSTVTVDGLRGPSDELPRSTRIRTITRHVVVTNRLARLQIAPRPTSIRSGSDVKFEARLVDETGAAVIGAPVNFFVVYDWPDDKGWDRKRYDLAARADLKTPGHRRFIASFAGLADTLDLEVVPR